MWVARSAFDEARAHHGRHFYVGTAPTQAHAESAEYEAGALSTKALGHCVNHRDGDSGAAGIPKFTQGIRYFFQRNAQFAADAFVEEHVCLVEDKGVGRVDGAM